MLYRVQYEVSCPDRGTVADTMLVEADSPTRAVESAQAKLEEQYSGEEGCVLLECQVHPLTETT